MLVKVSDFPSGFVTVTSQAPTAASDGMTNVQISDLFEMNRTSVAWMVVLALRESATRAPEAKCSPARFLIETFVPAYPSSGMIPVMDGPVGAVVVTVVADTVAHAVSPGVITVGVTTGTDDTEI